MTRKALIALGTALLATSAFAQIPPRDHGTPDADSPHFEQKLTAEQKAKFEVEWEKTWSLRAQFHRDQAQFDEAMRKHDKDAVRALHEKLEADVQALHAEQHLRNDIRGNSELHSPDSAAHVQPHPGRGARFLESDADAGFGHPPGEGVPGGHPPAAKP